MDKTYVLDTSALVTLPTIFSMVKNSRFIIPICVIEELDNLKTKMDQIGANARKINREIDLLRKAFDPKQEFKIGNGNVVYFKFTNDLSLIPEVYAKNVDAKIISIAKEYSTVYDTLLLSEDLALRIKASAIGVASDSTNIIKDEEQEETSFSIFVTTEELETFYSVGHLEQEEEFPCHSPVTLKTIKNGSAIGIYRKGRIEKLKFAEEKQFNVMGLKPKNREQRFALEFLLDQSIPLVSLFGGAGSGKTLLAIAAALKMIDEKKFKKIVITRPTVSISAGIGFLPGDLREKLTPWAQPIFDNMKAMFKYNDDMIEIMQDKGILEMTSLSLIRGRTFSDTIVILDEGQNTTLSEAKALISRMGSNSKLILIGDIEQIDSPKIDKYNSGLSQAVQKLRGSELVAHVELVKCERSPLADLAVKLL